MTQGEKSVILVLRNISKASFKGVSTSYSTKTKDLPFSGFSTDSRYFISISSKSNLAVYSPTVDCSRYCFSVIPKSI